MMFIKNSCLLVILGVFTFTAGCSYDVGGLTSVEPELCGNGVIDQGETCDGTALGGLTCEGEGLPPGVLSCASDCTLDTSGCILETCGNGAVDAGEACDGTALGAETCSSLGYTGGVLRCAANCTYDETDCTSAHICGDGIVDQGEECDLENLDGNSCETLGLGTGTLLCSEQCRLDTAGCIAPTCGDGTQDEGEVCDDGENDTCTGTCNATCSGPANSCGDGVVQCGEECEAGDLQGRDCTSFGYATPGGLACTDCAIDLSGCLNECGNGVLDTGEVCDDGNTGDANGTDDFCSPLCTTESWSCPGGWPGYMDPVNTDEQWATFTLTTIAGSTTGYAEGAAGSTITVSGHYQYDAGSSGCDTCRVQLYWGFFAGQPPASDLDPNAGFAHCIDYVNQNPSNDYTFTLTLPNQAGTYYLRWGRSWEYSCNYNTNYPDAGRNLAVICVY